MPACVEIFPPLKRPVTPALGPASFLTMLASARTSLQIAAAR